MDKVIGNLRDGTPPNHHLAGLLVVNYPSPYNAILGRPTLGGTRAITSTYHLKMKFPTTTGVAEVRGDHKVTRQCFISTFKIETPTPVTQ